MSHPRSGRWPSRRRAAVAALVVLAFLTTAFGGPAPAGAAEDPDPVAAAPTTERVSVATDGTQTTNPGMFGLGTGSDRESLSADGRFVAFVSGATNLVPGDTNGGFQSGQDVFVRDRQAGTTERVSVATDGSQAFNAETPTISDDGRYVAFAAINLGNTTGIAEVYVRDRQTGTTELVSVDDGSEVEIFGDASTPSISGDGRYVAFATIRDMVAGDANVAGDVYVRDRQTDTTQLVSVTTGGTQYSVHSVEPDISTDGQVVAFTQIDCSINPFCDIGDVYARDRQAGVTELVSAATGGGGAAGSRLPDLSGDGRYVAFESTASTLVVGDTNGADDVFVRDRQTDTTQRVSVADDDSEAGDWSRRPSISYDGSRVAFDSWATDLVSGDTNATADVFVRDTGAGTTERVSIAHDGAQGSGSSVNASISDAGGVVAFSSAASNLVPGDTNNMGDVFVRDLGTAGPTPTGQLRVTTTPAVPGQIVVDGIPRDSWGLNWVEFPVGNHEVCFGPVPGFTPPPCQNVQVLEDQTTVVDGAYTQRGTLRVLTSPAVQSTITIDGNPANDWGVWTDLDPGTYEICFGPTGASSFPMDPPPCEDAIITAGAYTEITGTFTDSPGAPAPTGHGYLRATTDPAVASRITIDGAVADTWGLTWLKLAPGDYDVCFEAVLYTTAPDCETVEVLADQTTVVQGGFAVHGFLKVNTTPAVGATISIDGQPANAWGVWTSLEPGTYEICYGPDPGGLTPPPCEDAVVSAGATTELTGTYT